VRGIDTVHKVCATYNVARNTRRCHMVIFYILINIASINSQIIFIANNNETKGSIVRRKYLNKLALSLTDEYLKRRATLTNLPPEVRQRKEVQALLPYMKRQISLNQEQENGVTSAKKIVKLICISHTEYSCPECSILLQPNN
jgi:hypothetical protein